MPHTTSAVDVEQLFRPKPIEEPVNVHVVEQAREREPDFEAMRRLIQGEDEDHSESARDESERREVPKGG
jgi:hypothetical protein